MKAKLVNAQVSSYRHHAKSLTPTAYEMARTFKIPLAIYALGATAEDTEYHLIGITTDITLTVTMARADAEAIFSTHYLKPTFPEAPQLVATSCSYDDTCILTLQTQLIHESDDKRMKSFATWIRDNLRKEVELKTIPIPNA